MKYKHMIEVAAHKYLVNMRIKSAKYVELSEDDGLWDGRVFVITLENDVELFASQDPEGNGPGSLFSNAPGLEIIGPLP